MDSIDKLRRIVCTTADGSMRCSTIATMLDAIEAELDEGYVELPKDAEGCPIRVGDELCGYGLPYGGAIVRALSESTVVVSQLGGEGPCHKGTLFWNPGNVFHVKKARPHEAKPPAEAVEKSVRDASCRTNDAAGCEE